MEKPNFDEWYAAIRAVIDPLGHISMVDGKPGAVPACGWLTNDEHRRVSLTSLDRKIGEVIFTTLDPSSKPSLSKRSYEFDKYQTAANDISRFLAGGSDALNADDDPDAGEELVEV